MIPALESNQVFYFLSTYAQAFSAVFTFSIILIRDEIKTLETEQDKFFELLVSKLRDIQEIVFLTPKLLELQEIANQLLEAKFHKESFFEIFTRKKSEFQDCCSPENWSADDREHFQEHKTRDNETYLETTKTISVYYQGYSVSQSKEEKLIRKKKRSFYYLSFIIVPIILIPFSTYLVTHPVTSYAVLIAHIIIGMLFIREVFDLT